MSTALDGKTLIGVMATHDDPEVNYALRDLLNDICASEQTMALLDQFHFVFTGGTYERLFVSTNATGADIATGASNVHEDTKQLLLGNPGCVTRLPSRIQGGVTVLAYLVTQRQVSILWPFLSPRTSHWLNPENLALMRLSDQWRVKRLMNEGSVREWLRYEAERDANRNPKPCPPVLTFHDKTSSPLTDESGMIPTSEGEPEDWSTVAGKTIALIAHDELKQRMVNFAGDHESELRKFKTILTTATTGRAVTDEVPSLEKKISRCLSGPKGGDIQIATEILYGKCDAVVFFIDPLSAHPHIDDIRVVFAACMIHGTVRMLTNEVQAREWMERVVRRASG